MNFSEQAENAFYELFLEEIIKNPERVHHYNLYMGSVWLYPTIDEVTFRLKVNFNTDGALMLYAFKGDSGYKAKVFTPNETYSSKIKLAITKSRMTRSRKIDMPSRLRDLMEIIAKDLKPAVV